MPDYMEIQLFNGMLKVRVIMNALVTVHSAGAFKYFTGGEGPRQWKII